MRSALRPPLQSILLSAVLSACLFCLIACGNAVQAGSASLTNSNSAPGSLSYATETTDPLLTYTLAGDVQPVHDPSIIRQGSTYYLFTTDVLGLPPANYLPVRCSQDKINWTSCGSIFPTAMPSWVVAKVPGIVGLWAPDVSYFNGLYHVYYAGSTLGSQRSVIGLVTNSTLDATDPAYQWVDQGEVLESVPGNDFNAIDPNILIDTDGSVWLTYGSYWTGIKQRQIDPSTGLLLASNPTRYNLATRPGVPNNPIEGASLVHHGDYYYLFVSIDYCCNANIATDNYKEAVGRSTSPHGPFVDENGTPMTNGGGTVLLQGDGTWNAPGGGTAYLDPSNGDSLIVFHALHMTENGALYLWLKNLTWINDWPGFAS
ncbi:MAG TPA: arabinan endo-1,5-alpha-L-arabinosidase [Acidobacteriaceae bacterium]|nr:arabinan endo-1,5-alpha-L-arabinosidase [Acidobacteriaceae bacterium]